ncbi:MAG: hypothetical protein LBU89_10130 [Fibromonadaceae bacterium]|jgi:hypothetical protein|nr:hypothetical protein [Fibromonadaceae bacterium]
MKKHLIIAALALVVAAFISCKEKDGRGSEAVTVANVSAENDFGNKQNLLFGKIYREITDIPELQFLENHRGYGGKVIRANDGRFGFSYYFDENENIYCFFEEFTQRDASGRPGYKILDTIHIGKLNDRERFIFDCQQNETEQDSEIFAIVLVKDDNDFRDKPYFDNIVRAWRANTMTGRIMPIESLKGIKGVNNDYGI